MSILKFCVCFDTSFLLYYITYLSIFKVSCYFKLYLLLYLKNNDGSGSVTSVLSDSL